jgi:hypothetical protein
MVPRVGVNSSGKDWLKEGSTHEPEAPIIVKSVTINNVSSVEQFRPVILTVPEADKQAHQVAEKVGKTPPAGPHIGLSKHHLSGRAAPKKKPSSRNLENVPLSKSIVEVVADANARNSVRSFQRRAELISIEDTEQPKLQRVTAVANEYVQGVHAVKTLSDDLRVARKSGNRQQGVFSSLRNAREDVVVAGKALNYLEKPEVTPPRKKRKCTI